jgi:3-hydroxybutyrate dehydrogenase
MLQGKTALITGSTLGLGYAVACRFAANGCNVVLNGIEAPAEVEPQVRRLETDFGIMAVFDGANVGDPGAVQALVAHAVDRFGGVDILVNNAVTRVFGPIEDCAPADWERAMAVNVSSAFYTIRGALPGMRQRNWGRIINMSSIYGMIGAANRASYVTAKTALIGLTRAVALEVADQEITCNAICPGSVNTTHSAAVIGETVEREGISEHEATKRFLAGKQPGGRFVDPDSVAELALFLCGPAGRDINGASLPVDLAWSAS